jgi:hypothetical protein
MGSGHDTANRRPPDRGIGATRDDAVCAEAMRALLTLIGIVAVVSGLLFVGQGTGYIPWPSASFMIGQFR